MMNRMKIVREHINEKFSEDSDPVKDLGIGLKGIVDSMIGHADEDLFVKFFPHLNKSHIVGHVERTNMVMIVFSTLHFMVEHRNFSPQKCFNYACDVHLLNKKHVQKNFFVRKESAKAINRIAGTKINPNILGIIQEKFTQDSDPIEDLGIGVAAMLKKYNIKTTFTNCTRKDKNMIKKFFGKPLSDVYYLGENEDFILSAKWFPKFYIRNLRNLCKNTNKIFTTEYSDAYDTTLIGYETKHGKILKMITSSQESFGNNEETFFIGEIGIAAFLEINKVNWKEIGYPFD